VADCAGVHWRDVRAVEVVARATSPCLPVPKKRKAKDTGKLPVPQPGKVGILVGGRIKYVDRPGWVAPAEAGPVKKVLATKAPKAPAERIDPKLLAKVRELRDRCLEYVNGDPWALSGAVGGKYEVTRTLGSVGGKRALPGPIAA
jgi:hypothetical protein